MKKLLTLALFVCGFMQVWAGNITGTWQDDNGITWYYSVHYDSNNPPIYATIEPVNKSSISGTVVIPSTVDGYTVRYINRDAFKECFQLTSVTIPDVVWGIGNSAFYGTGLKSVIIPSSIDNIGDSAFWNCSYLDNVTINSNSLLSSTGTKKTMSKIFTYRVKHYTIGEGVKTIGMMAFFACHMESVTIPTTVTNISVEAFALCQNLKNVTIPESVTSIGDAAFQNCNSLTNVNISERVKTIFNKTFEGCVSLQSVTIPDSVKTICLDAFAGCTSLKSITIPKSVQNLDKDAFRGCAGLISVTINCRIDEGFGCCYRFGPQVKYYTLGEGITGILPSFSGCTDMESVNIPSCVGISLKNTFNGCTSLKKVIVPNIAAWCNINFHVEEYGYGYIPDSVDATSNPLSVAKHLYSDENTEITELVIPEGVTRITKYAFYGCSGLESVSIPSSMTSIGPGAFRKCNLTKSSIYSDSIISKNYDANHNLYEVFGETNLFDLSKNVSSIGDYAFWGYDVYMGMMLPWNMASIGDHSLPRRGLTVYYIVTDLAAFCNNTTQSLLHHKKSDITCVLYDENLSHHIKECIIPDDVTSISDYAFSGCVYLNKVTIPESVTKIGWYAFDGCTYLRCLSIPSSASWGMDSFRNLNSLDTLYCYRPTPPKIYSNTFPNRSKAILYVPYGSKPAYQNADYWKNFKEIKGIPDSYDVWYFELVDSMATIVGSTQTTGDLVIPSVVFKNGTAYPVTSIGGSAFKGCVGLTSITVPQGVTSIGQNAFSGCSGLVTVKVPIIDMAAFCNNQVVGQIYSNLNKPIILIDSEGNEITKLVIPDGVTSIGKSAFRRCTGLTTATIGSGVTSIGNGAFLECTNLTNITIPLGVTTIDQYAFGGCTGLTSVTIPSSVTSIGKSAFASCTGLTSVTIPANSNLSDIGDGAFYNCTNFTTVIVPIIDMAAFCRNTIISMINSRIKEPVMLIDGDGNEITEYVIPENVTSIGSSAFLNCTGLTSVTIPESVTSIGRYAFSGCTSLTSITIPKRVTIIDYSAFKGCSGLTSVTVPESVTSIGKYAFSGCASLTSVIIPSSVTSIGNYAFSGCSSLTNVYCHVATPFSIDSKTFSNRANATLYVPYKTKDAYLAAEYWKEFKEIKEMVDSYDIWQFDISNSTAVILGTSQQSDNLTIPSVVYKDGQEYPVTSIDSGAFAGQTDLTSVTIPQSVTSIGADAFAGCTNLTNVKVIVEDMATFCNNQVVGQIKASINKPVTLVDREGNEITEYVIPNGVDSIGTNAFNNCTGLTGMTFPQSVTSIGADAFADCTSLTKVNVIVEDMATFCNNQVVGQIKAGINKPVTLVDREGNEITEYVIPNGVDSIGTNAFNNCTGLTGVTIPQAVTSVDASAFSGCTGLVTVKVIVTDRASFCTNTLLGQIKSILNKSVTLIDGSGNELTEYVIPNGVDSIGTNAFNNCTGLTSITIPQSVTSIDASAFTGCTNLTGVKIVVTDLAAFCTNTLLGQIKSILDKPVTLIDGSGNEITEYVIPADVKTIGANAFANCTGLTGVTIPQAMTSVDASAFSGCTGLVTVKVTVTDRASFCTNTLLGQIKSILDKPVTLIDGSGNEITEFVIPNGVDSIGTNAFNNCTGLTGVTIPQAVTSVDASAFSGCTGLVTVKVTVTDRASFCTNTLLGQIKSILDKPVTLIDGSGNELTEYVIPAGVKTIGTNAFANCTSLTSITIPQIVTSVDASAFSGCTGLVTVKVTVTDMATFCTNTLLGKIKTAINQPVTLINNNGNVITEYVIPENVTSIGSSAFLNCTGLTSVTIPESVTNIGSGAFNGSTNLTTVYCYVPTPLSIGTTTFSNRASATLYVPFGCKTAYQNANYWNGFKEIIEIEPDSYDNWYFDIAGSTATILGTQQPTGDLVIPSVVYKNGTAYPVTSIGAGAFNGCTGLTSITIPQSVTSIDATAFTGCTNLTGVKVMVTDFAAFCTNTLLGQIKSILDKPVTLIDGSGNELTEYVIPAGVKTIGTNAFANCTGLTGVTFPQAVTSIDASAFDGCINLTGVKVVVTDMATFCTNTLLGKIKPAINQPVTLINNNGNVITEYVIPENVTSIGSSAFLNCTGLTSVTIPQSVSSMGNSAFSGCNNLTTVKVSISDLESFCTNKVIGLIKSYINKPVTLIDGSGNEITEYVVPEGVSSIGASAFVNCSGLTSVTIPSGVTSIGKRAYSGCTSLTTVYCYVETPLSIDATTFSNRANATLYVPYGTKSAYQNASYWKGFKQIVEMDKVLTDSFVIGDFTFNNYNNLPEVEVSCADKNLTLGDLGDKNTVSHGGKTYTVTEISADAFKDCKKLVAVYLPDNNIRINAGAFKGCDNLKRIVFEGSTPPSFVTDAAEDAFDESHFNNVTLEVWRDKAAYTAHPQWKKFNTCIVRLLTGTKIKGAATVNNTSVDMNCRLFSGTNLLVQTGYYTPDDPNWSVKAISNINSGVLRIPETIRYNNKDYSVTLLGACSFGGVNTSGQGMGKVVIPNSVYCIDAECFANCRSLKEVIIGDGLTVVGNHVFYNCTSLKDIYVYATVPPGIRTDVASTVFSGVPSNCVLHVPEGSVNAYKNAVGWSRFNSIVKIKPGDETTGIEDIDASTDFDNEIEVYDLNGQRQPALRRGINIIRMKDGSTKKVLVK